MRIGCSIFAIAAALAGPAAAATATLSGVVSATGGVAPATVVYVEKGPDPARCPIEAQLVPVAGPLGRVRGRSISKAGARRNG